MNGDRIDDLVLKIAKIFALRSDAARSIWIVPLRHQLARLLVPLHLKCNFFRAQLLIISQRQSGHVIL